jgi:hypothetical protein
MHVGSASEILSLIFIVNLYYSLIQALRKSLRVNSGEDPRFFFLRQAKVNYKIKNALGAVKKE